MAFATAAEPGAQTVTMSVTTAKSEYLIGEALNAKVEIANHCDRPFLFRSIDPYEIACVDPNGKPVYNPNNESTAYLGIFPEWRIDPGQSRSFKLDLSQYCAPTASGTYHVRVAIKRSVNRAWPAYPADAVFSLRLRVPSLEEATEIVGQRADSNSGFNTCTLPVFAEPLRNAGLAHHFDVIQALIRIATPQATEDMIAVLREQLTAFPLAMASDVWVVTARMPGSHRALGSARSAPDAALWNDACTVDARQLAREMLAQSAPELKMQAAALLRFVGQRQDAASLARLCLQALHDDDGRQANPFRPEILRPAAFGEALAALASRGQIDRGDAAKDPLWTFIALVQHPRLTLSPAQRLDLVRIGFASPYPDLRAAAISSIPYPPTAEYAQILAKAEADPAHNVRAAALFVTQHVIDIAPPMFGGPNAPAMMLQLGTRKTTPDSAHWQVEFYTAQIDRYPTNADDYDNRGLAEYRLGQLDKALADFEQALRLRPRLAAAYNNRGLALMAKHQVREAIAAYSQALAINPKMRQAYFNRGVAYGQERSYSEALRDLSAAIEEDLDFAAAFGQRAAVERALGNGAAAEADEKEANALDPNWKKTTGEPLIQAGG